MRRASLFSALLSAFVLASCTALYYPGDDYLHGASDDAAVPADALTDRPTNADAPADAPVAPGPLVCPADAAYCDDFERDDVKGKYWDSSGRVGINTSHAHSPTRALLAVTVSGGDNPQVTLAGPVTARTRFDIWFYAPDAPEGGDSINYRIAQMLWGADCDWDLTWELVINSADGLYLNASSYDKSMNASCGPIANMGTPSLLTPAQLFVDRWHHVVVLGDASTSSRKASVDVDDTGVFTSVAVKGSRTATPTTASVALGIPCIRENGGCFTYSGLEYRVWIDDLVIVPQ